MGESLIYKIMLIQVSDLIKDHTYIVLYFQQNFFHNFSKFQRDFFRRSVQDNDWPDI